MTSQIEKQYFDHLLKLRKFKKFLTQHDSQTIDELSRKYCKLQTQDKSQHKYLSLQEFSCRLSISEPGYVQLPSNANHSSKKIASEFFFNKKTKTSQNTILKVQTIEDQTQSHKKQVSKQEQIAHCTMIGKELEETLESMSKLDKNKTITDYKNLNDFIDKNKTFMQITLLRKYLLQLRYQDLLKLPMTEFVQFFNIPHKLFLQNIELTNKQKWNFSFSFSNHMCQYMTLVIFSELFLLTPLLYRLANSAHKIEEEELFIERFEKLYYLFVNGQQNELISISADKEGLSAIGRSIYAIREQIIHQYQEILKELISTDSKSKIKYQVKPAYVEEAILITLKNFQNYSTTFKSNTVSELEKIIQIIQKDITSINDKLKSKQKGFSPEDLTHMEGQKKSVQFMITLIKNNKFLPSKKRTNLNLKKKVIEKLFKGKIKYYAFIFIFGILLGKFYDTTIKPFFDGQSFQRFFSQENTEREASKAKS